MRKTHFMLMSALLALVFVPLGCQFVKVEDTAGKAISWASVDVRGMDGKSKLLTPAKSGLDGTAIIPLSTGEGREQIVVSKDGYQTQTVTRRGDSTIKVRLPKIRVPKPPNLNLNTSDAKKK